MKDNQLIWRLRGEAACSINEDVKELLGDAADEIERLDRQIDDLYEDAGY